MDKILERPEGSVQEYYQLKSANQQIELVKLQESPKRLFDNFWFENELCFLFSEANVGKSILALQIADSITKGESIGDFRLEAQKQPVLYFDFELSDKQFENRYSENYKNHYLFDQDLFRQTSIENPKLSLIRVLELIIIANKIKVIIIDNLTFIQEGLTNTRTASVFIKRLKKLKDKHNLSILVLGHTPKRNATKPLVQDDLGGSKMLINFCDSAFAVGKSSEAPELRYIKQMDMQIKTTH